MYKLRSKRQKTAGRETSENLFLLLTWLRCNCEVNFEKTRGPVVCNRWEFWVCDGWVCDPEAIGCPSIFKLIHSAAAFLRMWPTVLLSFGKDRKRKKQSNFFFNMLQITLKNEEQREQFQNLQLQFSALRKQLVSVVAQVCFLERIRCTISLAWCGSLRVKRSPNSEGLEGKSVKNSVRIE